MELINNIVKAFDIDLKPKDSKLVNLLGNGNQLYAGAHIAAGIQRGSVFHHGIVVEVKEVIGEIKVIHFQGENKQDAKIKKTTLQEFLRNDQHSQF
jgi:hypothetical protein